jgi:serine/threonine protein kinase/Leucine-rich repeat (LRR) protein
MAGFTTNSQARERPLRDLVADLGLVYDDLLRLDTRWLTRREVVQWLLNGESSSCSFALVARMSIASTASLVDFLRQHRLLEAAQMELLASLQPHHPDPQSLSAELMRRGWLTAYQANLLLQGRGQELLLGSYVLLEKLGEGGMGQVFKARNWKLGRVVALKLIRKERLDNPDAVRRFQREVRAAAALSHPNIVHALDADEVGGRHILVMEHIEGTNLAKVVKKNGPLPVAYACDFIRQAALGLQHAHEKGMVHRDIKPANLLLAVDGRTVKVLDMGMARLDRGEAADEHSSTMTQEGTVVGTPDYIAPEQALESHTADIRADLYSLGCTLYYLLTGQVPFPGGTLIQKINKHQFHEPTAIESLRPDLPPTVAAVLRKLMAKRPDDRFQTPGELAAALASLASVSREDDRTVAEGARGTAPTEPSADTLGSPFASLRADAVLAESEPQSRRGLKEEHWLLLLVSAASLVVVGIVVLMVRLWPDAEQAGPSAEKPDPEWEEAEDARRREDAWRREVAALPPERQVEAVVARLRERNPGFDGKVTCRIEAGAVIELTFASNQVTDLSPLSVLRQLRSLRCSGSRKLVDLSPLQGMKLTELYCYHTAVTDLSPLKGMRLTRLDCFGTRVSDLTPLKDMPLVHLRCADTQVLDLTPLKDMRLADLDCDNTQVADLTPLKDMKLSYLYCAGTRVVDLTPLKDMRLVHLSCARTKVFDLTPLKDMKLTTLYCYGTQVSDLSPLKDMQLTFLDCNTTPVLDLSALKGMKLTHLECYGTQVSDLSPLKDMKLTFLDCRGTKVADLTALKDMKLTLLACAGTKVSDLSPLKDMKLQDLDCRGTKVSDLTPLQGMPLKVIECDFRPRRDAAILRSIKTLETINGKPAKQFWQEVDARKP